MPYLAHFGLTGHPFTLTPNIDYYFPTQETANIVASVEFALRRDTGIIKIVGEVGTGKTLLCRLLISKLVESEKVAYINAPQANADSIVRMVCAEFGLAPKDDEVAMLAALNRFLLETHAANQLAVVVVDEAQHLGSKGLEAIRLISNLETETRKLLQIVLFGQTELDDLLRDPGLRQLAQRISFSFNTGPMSVAESKRYIAHRVRVSRRAGVDYEVFSEGALELIARKGNGTPRVMNILADKSLLVAYAEGFPTVQRQHAAEAIRDTPTLGWTRRLDRLPPELFRSRPLLAAAALVLMLACGLVGWRLNRPPPPVAAAIETAAEPVAATPPLAQSPEPAPPAVERRAKKKKPATPPPDQALR